MAIFIQSPISDMSDVLNRLTGGTTQKVQHVFFYKDGRVANAASSTNVANKWHSMWQNNGIPSGVGNAPPQSGALCDNTLSGSLPILNPSTGNNWLFGVDMNLSIMSGQTTGGSVLIYDRLSHNGQLNATTVTPQLVSCSVSRYSGSLTSQGNAIFLEIYTQIGATLVNFNVNYKNQNGQSQTTPTQSFGGTNMREAQRFIPVQLQQGDNGVISVDSVLLQASTGTAGNFGVVVMRPLMTIPIATGQIVAWRDTLTTPQALPLIEAGACITFAVQPVAAGAVNNLLYGFIHTVEK
jgi:hypothetical protein